MTTKLGAGVNETETSVPPITARIYDNMSRKVYIQTIGSKLQSEIIAHSNIGLGRQWNYDKRWMYALCREGENVYFPVEKYLDQSRDNPPSELWGYLNQPEIGVTRNVETNRNFMQQYGHILPYILGIAFIIFMMVSSNG